MANELGQPTAQEIAEKFCTEMLCNALLCEGCPVYAMPAVQPKGVQPTCSTCGEKLRMGDIWWNECEECHSKIASG